MVYETAGQYDFPVLRQNMVEGQIRPNEVTDERVIEAFRSIPRELFVPEGRQGIAYVDEDLFINENRFLIEPQILARMIQAADISSDHLVLDLACASGYSTAILSLLADTVVGIEGDADLAENAQSLLQKLDLTNVAVLPGDPAKGYDAQAPYDVIIINGAVQSVPETLSRQLAEGGRLVCVVTGEHAFGPSLMGAATLTRRFGNTISTRKLFDAASPLLDSFTKEPGFEF